MQMAFIGDMMFWNRESVFPAQHCYLCVKAVDMKRHFDEKVKLNA